MSSSLDYLMSLPRFADKGDAAYRPGLERIAALLEGMGQPQEAFRVVHVGGTNGKGTTASLIAAIGTAAGECVGLHTSPHLVHVGERMRVDGEAAPSAWIESTVEANRALLERIGPSFFEATVALSLRYFAEREVDWAVVEVGLGGRLDATNVLRPEAAIVTHIALEHTDLLGTTLPAIAREKAGIFKRGVPAFTAVREPSALRVLEEEAARREAPLEVVGDTVDVVVRSASAGRMVLDVVTPVRRYDALEIGLEGAHHLGNVALGVRVAEGVLAAPEAAIRTGLREVRALSGLRGRFEVWSEQPTIITDVAHNPDALAPALAAAAARAQVQGGNLYVLLGLLRDKDIEAVARLCRQHGVDVYCASLPTERGVSPAELARVLEQGGVTVFGRGTVAEGIEAFRGRSRDDDVLLVTGSHWTVAQVLSLPRAQHLERTGD